MPQPLDIFAASLDNINLVEASAGTGKTYAIAGLYLRLVVERGVRVSDILVVTYTKAATAELRDRVRGRLVEARHAFQHEASVEPFCQQLLAHYSADRERIVRRLNNAILAFDEAAIFTIHGFCQRVLADSAFASGMPFETEILADESEVVREIVEDFWRRRLHAVRPLLANQVIRSGLSPGELQKRIQPYVGKPYLKISERSDHEDLAVVERAFEAAFSAARELWGAQRAEVTSLLLNCKDLYGNVYNAGMPAWFTEMDEYLGQEGFPDNPEPFNKFVNFTAAAIVKKTRRNKTPPDHAFFAACDTLNAAADRLDTFFKRHLQILHGELLDYCNEQLPLRKRRRQIQSYDDLLLNLRTALADGERGGRLAERIRKRYTAALIDEFQDTDPIQYDIFQSIYRNSGQPVFLVGDPKQAIYSFRGADIFAYLRARPDAETAHTLLTNYRSAPGLVRALNAVFGYCDHPFLLEQIPFHPVQAKDRAQLPVLVADDGSSTPLRIWFAGRQEGNKAPNKDDLRGRIAGATAGRIALLLNLAERGEAYIEAAGRRQALNGGDIAVLVRNHRQAMLIRDALLDLGVPSVQHSRASVFETPEAQELERLLLAICAPQREDWVRAALVTDLLGLSATDLERLMGQDQAWEKTLLEFNDYHQLWREQGFIRMFRSLLTRCEVYRRLLRFSDGERRLTNLLHLAELLQDVSRDQRLGMEGVVQWLTAQRNDSAADVDGESRQLRLESDAERVKIVTIHKSKGLEYPIVFCPFLWDGDLKSENGKQKIFSFHDPDDHDQAVLDLGSEQQQAYRPHAVREELAENLRLAYVAMTRAKHRVYTVWGACKDFEKSALAWLLYQPPVPSVGADPIQARWNYVKIMNDDALLAGLERLARASENTVHVSLLPVAEIQGYQPGQRGRAEFSARHFGGRLSMGWHFTSFTALQERRGMELPDDDADTAMSAAVVDVPRSMVTFPRGARAGRCLHALLERIDFTGNGEPLVQTTRETLRRYGFEEAWTEVVTHMLEGVLQAPLTGDLTATLSHVGRAQRLTELEFMYRFERLDAQVLEGLLREQGADWEGLLLAPLEFSLLEGFMRGVIDLICEVQGRVYLIDYKSNWLGPRREDYGPARLALAMAAGSYHLQYLIYTVALHRYLRWRRPDYDYERHFGGVRYLFLRGIQPCHPGSGIYAARPPYALIDVLDRYLNERDVAHA